VSENEIKFKFEDDSLFKLYFTRGDGDQRESDSKICTMKDTRKIIQEMKDDNWRHSGTAPVMMEYDVLVGDE